MGLVEELGERFRRRNEVENSYAAEFLKSPSYELYEKAMLSLCEDSGYSQLMGGMTKSRMSVQDTMKALASDDPYVRANGEESYAGYVFEAAAKEMGMPIVWQMDNIKPPHALENDRWLDFRDELMECRLSMGKVRSLACDFRMAIGELPDFDTSGPERPDLQTLYKNIPSEFYEKLAGHQSIDDVKEIARRDVPRMVPDGLAKSWAHDVLESRHKANSRDLGARDEARLSKECPNIVRTRGGIMCVYDDREVGRAAEILKCTPEEIYRRRPLSAREMNVMNAYASFRATRER